MKKTTIGYLLTFLILSQSCVVYEKASTPLAYAALYEDKAKIIKTNSAIIYVEDIVKVDSVYYMVYGQKRIPLKPSDVKAIYMRDMNKYRRVSWHATWTIYPISSSPIYLHGTY